MNRFFATGREFSLIEKMFSPDRFSRNAAGLGDDAFLFKPASGSQWAVTSDASAEGVHFRLDWVSPERALRKALLANLSDINAMGGRSRHVFFNLGARPEWDESVFIALGRALRELEETFDFRVSGGDTVRTSGAGFFAFTVLGDVAGRPLLRSACKPGHRIYVSGMLGGSAAGLRLLKRGDNSEKNLKKSSQDLIKIHLDPIPPLLLGPALASLDRDVAAIDISDGLSSELGHLSRQSGCLLRVEWEKMPLHSGLVSEDAAFICECVLNGGEEYQLLFTGDFSETELAWLGSFASISEIGAVEAGEGVFLTEAETTSPLPAHGYSHG